MSLSFVLFIYIHLSCSTLSGGYCLRHIINVTNTVLFFQVAASEVLPASMFMPVPGPEKDTQTAPPSIANSNSDDTKKQTG